MHINKIINYITAQPTNLVIINFRYVFIELLLFYNLQIIKKTMLLFQRNGRRANIMEAAWHQGHLSENLRLVKERCQANYYLMKHISEIFT